MDNEVKQQLIEQLFEKYDDGLGMMFEDFDNPNAYHTKLRKGRLHRFVTSSSCAVALFDAGVEKYYAVANRLVKNVIDGQCKKEGKTYGLWSYFYEESLDEMDAPDWNMADFNGISLLQILLDHPDKLEDGNYELVKNACLMACASIIKRDVTISYTNVAVMDIYMTIVCGERYDKKIYDFGISKLKRFYHYVMNQKSYEEYNSPTYSVIVIEKLGLMLKHIKDEAALRMINELNDLAWKMIAEHYHKGTGEWAGPHSRAYSQFITDDLKTEFEDALDNKLSLCDKKVHTLLSERYTPKCPEKYKKLFTEDKELFIRRMLSVGFNSPWFAHSRLETIYMTPEYALGSFHINCGWNQHRNIVAYMGNTKEKYCFRMRTLHDGYDFHSAFLNTIQDKSAVMTMVNYSTDRGDTHGDLDKVKNATISADDMRIRYEFEKNIGDIEKDVNVEQNGNRCTIFVADRKIQIGFEFAEFDDFKPYLEVCKNGRFMYIDFVLYHGERKDINFKKLDSAISVSWFTIDNDVAEYPTFKKENELLRADWNVNGSTLSLAGIYAPNKFVETVINSKQYLNGVWLEELK